MYGFTYSFAEEHPSKAVSTLAGVILMKNQSLNFLKEFSKGRECCFTKSATFQPTTSLSSFEIL